jgi:hypothetical protein
MTWIVFVVIVGASTIDKVYFFAGRELRIADADQDAPKDGLLRGFPRIKMDVLTEFQLSGFTYLIHSPSFEVNGNRTDQGV